MIVSTGNIKVPSAFSLYLCYYIIRNNKNRYRVSTWDAEYTPSKVLKISTHIRREDMIQMDGFYTSKHNGVVIEKFEDELATHPLDDKYAKDIVATNNANIEEYSYEFALLVRDAENIDFGDWIKYNTGLMPYIKRAADTVHWLHANGYTDYKVNMQSGIIK